MHSSVSLVAKKKLPHLSRMRTENQGVCFLAGFNAYVGYLLLEHTHANPVLVTFCQLLIKTLNDRNALEKGEKSDEANHVVHHNPSSSKFTF